MKKNYILLLFLLLGTLSLHAQLQYAMCFDGVNDFAPVYRTTETGIFGTNANNDSFTIEFWVKDNGNGGKHLYSKHYDNGTQKEGYFIEKSPTGTVTVGIANTSNTWSTITGVRVINDGNWHHIAYTFDFSTNIISLYVDGVPEGTLSGFTAVFGNTVDARLASSEYENTYFGGAFDEVKIWNTVKTGAEINSFKNAPLNTSSLPSDLILYYQCNEGIPDNDNWILYQLVDHTGNGRPGDLWNVFRLGPCSNWVHSVSNSALTSSPVVLASSLPADNATNITTDSNIVLTFNKNIAFGTGNIQIIDVTDGSNTITIDAASPGTQASISGGVLTLNPSVSLDSNSNYAVQIAATAIDDTDGNSYAGITDNTLLNFTTFNPDLTPPIFENSTPSVASITTTGFTLNTDINEAGTIYYVVVADGATAPISAEVKAGTGSGGSGQVTSGNAAVSTGDFTNGFSITGLTAATAYDLYVVAQDDENTPNLQASPTLVNVTTTELAKIVITEIMYNIPGVDNFEYVELYNAGSSTVNLTGYSFSQAFNHTFASGSIGPGEYFVITSSTTHFDTAFGAGTADAQWTSGGLNNTGETIVLSDNLSQIVDSVLYDDGAPSWPPEGDGTGSSIRLVDLTSDNNVGANWSASDESTGIMINDVELKGTPGLAANSDLAAPLFENSTPSASSIAQTSFTLETDINEAGIIYYIVVSDGATAPTSAEVKAGTASGGGVVISSQNTTVTTGTYTNNFTVTGLTASTAYDVYVVAQDDKTTPNLQVNPTKIDVSTIALPPLASVVITEIMYNPAEAGNDLTEYIELYNAGSSAVDLTGYSFTQGVAHTFTGGSINAGEYFVITANLTELDNKYGAGTADVQWTTGGLSNSGEDIELKDAFSRVVDYVDYDDNSPWPTGTDGDGASIRLCDITSDNSLAANWSASDEATDIIINTREVKGTPGQAAFCDTAAPVFENSTPSSANIDRTSFTLNADINEAGTIYYVVVVDGATAPTSTEVKAGTGSGGSGQVTSENSVVTTGSFTNAFSVIGLTVGTAYDVYVVAEDDTGIPNLQTFPTKIDVTTAANIAPTFTSTAITTVNEGDTYTYIVTTNDADADPVTVTATTKPSWLSLTTTPGGEVTTLAGSGSVGSTDATGIAASFNSPNRIAIDGSGNVYITDQSNHKIRKITPVGVVTTLAGSGSQGSTDGIGTAASFSSPYGIAIDGSGNVYVADNSSNKIRKITPAGVVSTLAGSAIFNSPRGIAVDDLGNVYVADSESHKILKITPVGVVSTLAGTGSQGNTDGPGTSASFEYPEGVVVDDLGNVYVADYYNFKIRKITPAGVVSTLAGSGNEGSSDGTGTAASFSYFGGITIDGSGNIYVADAGNSKIRKITPAGVVTTLAEISGIGGVTIDGSGNIYVTDQVNHEIRKITTKTTLSGSPTSTEVGSHNVVLQANDGNGGTVQQPFTITVADITAPVFENSTPTASSITQTGFTLETDIDESGTIYYVVVANGATAPTSAEVKAGTGSGGSGQVASSNAIVSTGSFTNDFNVSGLTVGTAYDVYLVAQDDEGTPNLQANPTKLDITTMNVTIAFTNTSSNGAESTSSADLEVGVNAVSTSNIMVDYTVTGTATGGTDYTLANGTLTINAGDLTSNITIASIVDDIIVEANETIIVTLSNPSNATLGTNTSHTYTINNNDTASVTIENVIVTEGVGGTILTLTLDNAVQGGFSVDVSTLDGTATAAGVDYATIVSQIETFAGTAGERQTVIVAIRGNSIAEADEMFTIFMNNLVPVSAPSTAINITDSGTITILDDDSGYLAVNDVTMAENADGATTDFTFTVTFTGQIDTGFTVDYGTGDNTATAGSDYVAKTGQLNFVGTPNETQTFTVTVNNDDIVESNENFGVQLSNVQAFGRNVTISDGDGIGTINNDDSASVTIEDVSSNEDDGAQTFTATLDNAVQGGFTVDVNTLDATATIADGDYTAVTGQTLTFTGTVGETQTFTVTPTSDNKVEADEIVTIGMTTVDNTPSFDDISITDIATLTILNDDSATVTLVGDIIIDEDAGNAILTATLDNAVQGGFFIHITTSDGTAVSTTDYTASNDEANTDFSGTAGETQSIFVPITDDMIGEPTESFTVTLSSVSGTTLGASITTVDAATVTINDNDAPVITTTAATSVTQLSATLGGNVTNAGGATVLDRGVVYSITSENNDPMIGGTGVTQDTNATGVGVFSESITGLLPGTQYSFKAYATNTSGTGYGSVMNFTTPALVAPILSFEDIAKTYGDADFTLEANSNSTGTISYSIVAGGTGSASLSGTNNEIVNIGNAGTVTIRATQVAGGIYTAAVKDMTLTIEKAVLTVTADNQTREYGDVNPSFTIGYAGFKGNDDTSVLDTAPTANSTATISTDVGIPSIIVSGGVDNNYDFNYASGTLTITQATLTVTADNQSKVYGEANPSFTIDYAGFKGSDDVSVLDTAPTAASTAVDNTNVGTVDITLSTGSDNNYALNAINGTLTITQRPIEVTADDKTKERTTTDPAFTYMITNGDLVTGDSFTGDLTRDPGEASGTYAITQGALTLGSNYDLTFVSGTLTIEDTIAPNPPSITHISDYTCVGDTSMTGDNTIEISGIAEENSTVEVFIEGISVGTVTTASNGFFTYDYTGTVLADGTYNITGQATDIAGNTSVVSATFTITINSVDTDNDGIPDVCDDDYDGNGVDDVDEDCDNDGIVDSLDTDNSSCASAITETKQYGFSPNGDGINDEWFVENITAYPNSVVQVFNRSGKLVFKKKGYQNDWQGVSNQISGNGNRLPVGPYLFIIDLGDGSKPTRGWIYINY